jgi:hypothetical protein
MKKINLFLIKEVFVVASLIIGVILSYQLARQYYYYQPILKQTSLSATSTSLISQFKEPLRFTLYSKNIDLSHKTQMLIQQYQWHQPTIQFIWHNQSSPVSLPSHALVVEYGEHKEVLDLNKIPVNENQITQLLFKFHRQQNQWVVFLQGHNEASPFDTSNSDMSLFRMALENQGIKIQRLNLTTTPFIPENTRVLVIAANKTALTSSEETHILNYLTRGGDLLWLIDPTSHPISGLSDALNIYPLQGTIIDLHGQKLGTPHPAITVIEQYPALPFQPPQTLTAFPWAVGLKHSGTPTWQTQVLLQTHESTWTEFDDLAGNIAYEPEKGEVSGPLILGVSLTRTHPHIANATQRIAVIGNSRFLCNSAIQNYGNMALGLNLMNWLNHDDNLTQISQPIVQDTLLQIHFWCALVIEYGFAGLPLLLLFLSMLYFILRTRSSNQRSTALSLT